MRSQKYMHIFPHVLLDANTHTHTQAQILKLPRDREEERKQDENEGVPMRQGWEYSTWCRIPSFPMFVEVSSVRADGMGHNQAERRREIFDPRRTPPHLFPELMVRSIYLGTRSQVLRHARVNSVPIIVR